MHESFWRRVISEVGEQSKTSLPSMLGMLLYKVPWLISLRFVGKLGSEELAAAALATTLCNVTGMSLSVGLSSAMTTLTAQARGDLMAKKRAILQNQTDSDMNNYNEEKKEKRRTRSHHPGRGKPAYNAKQPTRPPSRYDIDSRNLHPACLGDSCRYLVDSWNQASLVGTRSRRGSVVQNGTILENPCDPVFGPTPSIGHLPRGCKRLKWQIFQSMQHLLDLYYMFLQTFSLSMYLTGVTLEQLLRQSPFR